MATSRRRAPSTKQTKAPVQQIKSYKKRIVGMGIVSSILIALGAAGILMFKKSDLQLPTVTNNGTKKSPKLILLGLDGGEWRIVQELLDKGEMPNLKKLMENGITARPIPLNPTVSPAIWTTVATGNLPAKHGINNFVSKTGTTGEYTLVSSKDRQVKALWNILTEHGLKVGLFGWTASWPIEPTLGYTVGDVAVLNPNKAIYPENLRAGIIANTAKNLKLADFINGISLSFPAPKSVNDPDFFAAAHEKIDQFNRIYNSNSVYSFKAMQPDVLMEQDDVLDAAQHLFFKFKYPDEFNGDPVDPKLVGKYGDFLDSIYRAKDKVWGEIIETAGTNTHIIVMSDHGFYMDPASGYRFDQFNIILEILGLLKKKPDGSIDYAQTIAFECNNNTFDWQRRLCINLIDRQKQGIIPQKDFEKVRETVFQKLLTIKTTEGESIFHKIERSNSIDADITYDLKRNLTDKTLLIDKREFPVKKFLTLAIESGNHYANPEGPPAIFVWSGPGIKKNTQITNIRHKDYMPNILYALGLPIPKDIDGVFVPDLFEDPHEPIYIESYEDTPIKFFSGAHENVDDGDEIRSIGNSLTLFSSLKKEETYKQFCFRIPENPKDTLNIDYIKTSNRTDLKFNPSSTSALQSDLPFTKQVTIENIPRLDTLQFGPKDFILQPDNIGLWREIAPLDAIKPSIMGIWTNFYFDIRIPSAGTVRLIAKGDPVNNVYPLVEIKVNGKIIQTVSIDSKELKPFDIVVPNGGTLRVSYINDGKNAKEDRNLYIQRVKFSSNGQFAPDDDFSVFMQQDQLCFHHTKKGSLELQAKLIPHTEEQEDIGRKEALDVLQNTGVLHLHQD